MCFKISLILFFYRKCLYIFVWSVYNLVASSSIIFTHLLLAAFTMGCSNFWRSLLKEMYMISILVLKNFPIQKLGTTFNFWQVKKYSGYIFEQHFFKVRFCEPCYFLFLSCFPLSEIKFISYSWLRQFLMG